MQDIGKLRIGERQMLECDLQLEMDALPKLKEAIAYCEESRDFVSRGICRFHSLFGGGAR